MFFDQREYDIRCEWGSNGIAAVMPMTEVFVIVDVLSFSTSVDIAVGHGACVLPYRWNDDRAVVYAQTQAAILADRDRTSTSGYSLAPSSLLTIPPGTRLVLPSPNGATLSLATHHVPTFTGCLRNATAVAHAAQATGRRISVIAAGERWPDGGLRPAIEDMIGAGAIISQLHGPRSPEAAAAEHLFYSIRTEVSAYLQHCSSGKELIGRGCADDVLLAGAVDTSTTTPMLRNGAYR